MRGLLGITWGQRLMSFPDISIILATSNHCLTAFICKTIQNSNYATIWSFSPLLFGLLYAFTPEAPVEEESLEVAPFAVVELFTSQGCSSCPPADAQLARLVERAAKTGENIIALSFHVDYWNRLGWEDPYSSNAFSERQYRYSGYLNSRVYTPQMVVNGQTEFVGSRKNEAEAAVAKALAQHPTHTIETTFTQSAGQIRVAYEIEGAHPANAVLLVAITQDKVETSVLRGENRGRDLVHAAVVRDFIRVEKAPAKGSAKLNLPKDVTENFAVIAYLQDGETGQILGATRAIGK